MGEISATSGLKGLRISYIFEMLRNYNYAFSEEE